MRTFMTSAKSFLTDESGATMMEYALIVSLVAVAALGAVSGLGTALSTSFSSISGSV
jgi:pilus assembly protein Flp/PilA